MAFFASRSGSGKGNGHDAASELRGLGLPNPAASSPSELPGEPSGLPPWVENAVKKLLASVLPQFKPLIDKTELVLADAQSTLAALRAEQQKTQVELNSLRLAQVEALTQIAALKASVDRLALLSVDPG